MDLPAMETSALPGNREDANRAGITPRILGGTIDDITRRPRFQKKFGRCRGKGDLLQWDTPTHDWIDGRGKGVRDLVRLIDHATSRSWGRFVPTDGTRENSGVLWEYIERNGRPVEVYTDRHAMFAVPPRAGESEWQRREAERLTQIGRALRELGIGWIAAHSPPALTEVAWLCLSDDKLSRASLPRVKAPSNGVSERIRTA
jgi:hypothetical protein